MPGKDKIRRWRRVLCVTATCGLFGIGGVRAQGLDMDAGTGKVTPAAHQSGELDMDVNPDTPIPPKAAVQAVTGGNVQDGIAPLSGQTATDTPSGPVAGPATPVVGPVAAPATPVAGPADTPVTPTPVSTTVVGQPAVAPAVATPAVAPEPVVLDHPKVIDTAKLQAGDTTVSLYGIEGMTGASAQGLQGFLAAGDGHVNCQAQASSGFVCLTADGTNVAQVALVNGAAKTTPDAPDSYRQQEAAAQDARRGIWANLPPPPATVKHPVVQDTSTLVADGKTYILDGVIGFQAPYAGQLQGYIAGNGDSVTCSPQNDAGQYICLMPDGTDVAKVALVNGAARVDQDAPDAYRVQQLDALNNRRGYWATAPEAVLTAALLPPEPDVLYTLVAGDDGSDGITYVGGAPVALIDGESTFLVYGDDGLGWGYYDGYHHWHDAPDRYRRHMEHFHPGGHGLRGHDAFHHDAGMRGREDAMRRDGGMRGREEAGMRGREDAMRHDAGMRGREDAMHRDAGMRGREEAGMRGREEAGRVGGARPGMAGPMGRPGMAGPMGRPGMGGPGARPGNMAMAAGRPLGGGAPGGFMRPGAGASAGGFHPGGMGGGGMRAAPAMHASAPAMHASAPHGGGGGGGGKHR
jgi:endonuclease YncB( thermonuclease family)